LHREIADQGHEGYVWQMTNSEISEADQVHKALVALVGQLVWNVHRGVGTFLTMEFGEPHLSVREPKQPRSATSANAQRVLMRRRIYVTGDWHFWVKYGHWKLSSSRGSLEETTPSGPELDGCLDDLDGQRVIGIAIGPIPHSCILRFDLGAELEICPSKDATDDQWSLHNWNGKIIAYRNDGVIVFEPPS
jgi:hypothetical protein